MESKGRNKAIFEVIPLTERDCLYVADRSKSEFTYPMHSHRACELNFTQNANGVKRTVGDSVEEIGDYDLVLIANGKLEHVWEQHNCICDKAREITVHFRPDLVMGNFVNKLQFESIRRMLQKAECGIAFPMSAILKVYHMLDTLSSEKSGFYMVMKFFAILYELSQCEQMRVLSSYSLKTKSTSEDKRIADIQDYISKNYMTDIRLPNLAKMAGMSPVAFSRLFKQKIGKSLSDYIIDMRLGYASRFLLDSTNSISDISYECGFNNLSNFNRIFKKKKNCSPKEFRETFRKRKRVV